MHSQSCLIKNRISTHQGNFFTPVLEIVNWLTKNAQTMAHEFTIICDEVRIFKTQIQHSRSIGKLKEHIYKKRVHLVERILKFY